MFVADMMETIIRTVLALDQKSCLSGN